MKFTRRVHMYFGLVLTPFVLLYGVTAMLFNHPTWFSDAQTSATQLGAFADVALMSADETAAAVTALLAAASDAPVERAAGDKAVFEGDFIVDVRSEDTLERYRISPESMEGTVRRFPVARSAEGNATAAVAALPSSVQSPAIAAGDALTQQVQAGAATEDGRATLRAAPDVTFNVLVDGEPLVVTCDLRTGEIDARAEGEPKRPFELRSFLTRLHVSHGYPDEANARWVWAVIVDIVAALMIFWALSGVLMWWQMKPTRTSGGVLVIAGLVLAGVLGYAMYVLIHF